MIRSRFLPKPRDVVNSTMPRSRCPMPHEATRHDHGAPSGSGVSRGSRYVAVYHVVSFIRPADMLAHHARPFLVCL
jgi:hypothetical protein